MVKHDDGERAAHMDGPQRSHNTRANTNLAAEVTIGAADGAGGADAQRHEATGGIKPAGVGTALRDGDVAGVGNGDHLGERGRAAHNPIALRRDAGEAGAVTHKVGGAHGAVHFKLCGWVGGVDPHQTAGGDIQAGAIAPDVAAIGIANETVGQLRRGGIGHAHGRQVTPILGKSGCGGHSSNGKQQKGAEVSHFFGTLRITQSPTMPFLQRLLYSADRNSLGKTDKKQY